MDLVISDLRSLFALKRAADLLTSSRSHGNTRMSKEKDQERRNLGYDDGAFALEADRRNSQFRAFLLVLLVSFAGCQQGVYRASSLPPQYQASREESLDTFQLTHLGPGLSDSETIHPGDSLQVTVVAGDEDMVEDRRAPSGWEIVVAEDGSIAVPLIGSLRVGGLSLARASNAIREASIHREIYRDPTVAVAFKKKAMNRVTVTGAVEKPGTYELRAGASNLAAALAAAEGLSEEASPIVEIQAAVSHQQPVFGRDGDGRDMWQANYDASRNNLNAMPGPGPVRLNLLGTPATAQGMTAMNPYLHDGTVVTVMRKPERLVTMMGLTGNKVIPLPHGREVRLLDALSQAGGPKHSNWIADKVTVIRQKPGSNETIMIEASIREAKRNSNENLLLAAGDVVSVEENALTFTIDTLGALVGVGYTATRAAATSGL
jgi:polysaccharide export outer membrane protein